jgi:ATP-dependent Clp protease protease subunit
MKSRNRHAGCERSGDMGEFSQRLVEELVDAVKDALKKEQSERLRDVYLVGDIDKDTARAAIERIRELANDGRRPITFYMNTAGGNVTDGLALHDAIQHVVSQGVEVTIIVQGMAYSMGSVVLQAASPGRRLCFPHSWIMIHEPAKWAGWQSTTAAAQHLDRLKQMQSQIYRILSARSGRPLKQIIRDTKRTDLYLDATKAFEYGLVDQILGVTHASTPISSGEMEAKPPPHAQAGSQRPEAAAASERPREAPGLVSSTDTTTTS